MLIADTEQIRRADQLMINNYEFPGLLLMESAGRIAAETMLCYYLHHQNFLILCGPGNNGGDGFVIARYLLAAGKQVEVLIASDPEKYAGDAKANYRSLRHHPLKIHQYPVKFPETDEKTVLVDALLGTGVESELRGSIKEIIDHYRMHKGPVVAVDLPSGLDASSGKMLSEPLKAELTCTFHLPKACHYVMPAAGFCGKVEVIDIGILPEINEQLMIRRFLLTDAMLAAWYRMRDADTHKGDFGHAIVAGGSRNMAGAIAMAAHAAMKSGAGYVTALIPGSARCALYREDHHELLVRPQGNDNQEFLHPDDTLERALEGKAVVAAGPGMGKNDMTKAFLQQLISEAQVPLVLDADALNILADHPEWMKELPEGSVLTPHPGEMKRLSGVEDVQSRRLEAAESFARDHKVILVLKGANTLIALPDGRTYVNPTGNAGMASAGMGDVLTGIITGLIASGYAPEQAAPMAVWLHGCAGDIFAEEQSPEALTAPELMERLGKAFRRMSQ